MKLQRFLLAAEESELLLAFEQAGNIEGAAALLGKDASGVSRQLSAVARKCQALEKRGGRWALTGQGRSFNTLARNMIEAQAKLLENRPALVIGTNREFGARVAGPGFASLQKALPRTQLTLFTFENGTEEALLKGKIDVGLDCGRPFDPAIGYKLLLPEPIVAVCSKAFRKEHEKAIRERSLYRVPHLLCERLHPDKIFAESENRLSVAASFNDIATTRAACIAGAGWSLLPRYAVREEVQQGKLVVIEEKKSGLAHYGLWWARSRSLAPEATSALMRWLKGQEL